MPKHPIIDEPCRAGQPGGEGGDTTKSWGFYEIMGILRNHGDARLMPTTADDPGLEMSKAQATAFHEITDYLTGGGEWLCSLSMFIWITTVVQEVSAALRVIGATAPLRGPKTVITSDKVLKTVGEARVFVFVGLQLTRAALAITLGYGGAYFLARTIQLKDLLLNGVALEVLHCCIFVPCVCASIVCAQFGMLNTKMALVPWLHASACFPVFAEHRRSCALKLRTQKA